MDIETTIKYLNYVSQECDRHLKKSSITDDDFIHIIVEFQRFRDNAQKSKLPAEIKSKISALKFNHTVEGVERGTWYLIVAFLTFGAWARILYMRKQGNRKQTLNEIKFDTSRLASSLRLNY